METDDNAMLLRSYAVDGSDAAFVELMRRYMDLVYGAAVRRLNGDTGLAEDIVQRVFMELSVNAGKLRGDAGLGGWLYGRANHLAADVHKAECRRRLREKAASELAGPEREATSAWAEASPHLEDAIGQLPPADRDALVLRFMENHSLRAVGDALGVSEDAVQKRITRALEKLRRLLEKRGIACSTGGLFLALSKYHANPAPAALLQSFSQPGVLATAANLTPTNTTLLLPSLIMKPSTIAIAASLTAIAICLPILVTSLKQRQTTGAAGHQASPPAATPRTTQPLVPPTKTQASGTLLSPEKPRIALLPGITLKELETALRTARASAEKVTLERTNEKLERLRTKLKLTPEQDTQITAYHLTQRGRWVEYLTHASVGEADPQYYHLETTYRPSVPTTLVDTLSPEQKEILAEHETTRRVNFLEAVTNGELNSLALQLELPETAKDSLFQSLSSINKTNLFADLSGIHDLDGVAAQADYDISQRRTAFASVLDAGQMKAWESLVAKYRSSVLQKFGYRENPNVITG